jgi:Rrf2 family nitric oxide-sensitive transcriptional repressor
VAASEAAVAFAWASPIEPRFLLACRPDGMERSIAGFQTHGYNDAEIMQVWSAMRLSSYTDYALRLLMYLAVRQEGLPTISEVAQVYGISKNHLMKVANDLGRGGFIETVRGRNGGLRLGRPAEQIRIGDIVRYTEEDMAIVDCMGALPDSSLCRLSPACNLRSALHEALQAFLAVLDDYSLADIVRHRRSMASMLGLPQPPVLHTLGQGTADQGS